jgi:diguanylate cyclase (GGDEF)-like protein
VPQSARSFDWRAFVIISLISAVILATIVAVPQWMSRRARFQVLRSHVEQVAKLAASVVDGDLHHRLLDPNNYTKELYDAALAPLVRFHSANPEIFYVYTMVARGDTAYFVLDTANSRELVSPHHLEASAYMERFNQYEENKDDWLEQLAAGKSYVYPRLEHDDYGYFLSGHAPIYDSHGVYSGFVGVDYDINYYLKEETRFKEIAAGSLSVAFLLSLAIGYLAAHYHQRLNRQVEQHYFTSIRDELTSLLNRRGALDAVGRISRETSTSYGFILLDVDDLKAINDTHGHAAGDAVIMRMAEAIRGSVRGRDVSARLGGDEFMIFAADCDAAAATEMVRRIFEQVSVQKPEENVRPFSVSAGICIETHAHAANFDAMYRKADEALYRSKSAGKRGFAHFDG